LHLIFSFSCLIREKVQWTFIRFGICYLGTHALFTILILFLKVFMLSLRSGEPDWCGGETKRSQEQMIVCALLTIFKNFTGLF